jgi:hypothetical protein
MTLIIREEQREVFRRAQAERFVDKALSDLRRRFPDEVSSLGDDATRASIREGMERAEAHGIEMEIDVIRFIRFMFLLGRGFDDDPRYPWVREVLDDAHLAPVGKMAVLCRFTEHELGPDAATRVS